MSNQEQWQVKYAFWGLNSKNCQNWLMPTLMVWVTMTLTKNISDWWCLGESVSSSYIQNRSELPPCRHSTALKVFSGRDWLTWGSDVKALWLFLLVTSLNSGLIWRLRHVFPFCAFKWAHIEGVWSVGRKDWFSVPKHFFVTFKKEMFALICVLKTVLSLGL